jgi:hypothetical protein
MARYLVRVWIDTDIPDDLEADATVEVETVVDIGNGRAGIVGRVVRITIEPRPATE